MPATEDKKKQGQAGASGEAAPPSPDATPPAGGNTTHSEGNVPPVSDGQDGAKNADSAPNAPSPAEETPREGGSHANVITPDAPPSTGATPGEGPPAGDGKPPDPPPSIPPGPPPGVEKRRIRCESLKGQKLIVGSETVELDENGVFEVGEKDAARLLTIPGYKEA